MPTWDLTSYAEDLGKEMCPESLMTLLALSRHASCLVREGAVYGLLARLGEPGARDRVMAMAESDDSPGVREAAQDIEDSDLSQGNYD